MSGSKSDEVYDLVRRMIVRTELPPGASFVEREIAAQIGYGTTPVREALNRLDRDGFIVTIPRRGYRVTAVTAKSVDDFIDVWKVIVPLIMKTALERMSPEQAAQIDQSFDRYQSELECGSAASVPVLSTGQETYR